MKEYLKIFQECNLFQNIPEEAYIGALKYLRARKRNFKKGEFILHIGDEFHHAGLVMKGKVECSFQDSDFNKYNMNHFSEGDLFGSAMACAEISTSPMQISALSDCVILFFDYKILYDHKIKYEYQIQIAVNLIRIFSKQNFFLNKKVRILSQKEIRNKILTYLRNLQPDENDIRKIPFSKTALAEFLCVNRTALSRELSRMSKEGLLKMNGRNFILTC